MTREKRPITDDEYQRYRIILFTEANTALKAFAKKLADYCWNLDRYAVVQDWGGKKESLIAFGVPPESRKVKDAKNYFTIFKVTGHTDQKLRCEVCFPMDNSRIDMLKKYDTKKKLKISTLNQCEGLFGVDDYDYVVRLVDAARSCRLLS